MRDRGAPNPLRILPLLQLRPSPGSASGCPRAQIGAAIGREFSHTLLVAVARKPEAETASALDRLVASGLVIRQGMPPQPRYAFKHALVRDAAYGTLLRGRRKELHGNIAQGLECGFPEIVET